jgi:hypothetical protein
MNADPFAQHLDDPPGADAQSALPCVRDYNLEQIAAMSALALS